MQWDKKNQLLPIITFYGMWVCCISVPIRPFPLAEVTEVTNWKNWEKNVITLLIVKHCQEWVTCRMNGVFLKYIQFVNFCIFGQTQWRMGSESVYGDTSPTQRCHKIVTSYATLSVSSLPRRAAISTQRKGRATRADPKARTDSSATTVSR